MGPYVNIDRDRTIRFDAATDKTRPGAPCRLGGIIGLNRIAGNGPSHFSEPHAAYFTTISIRIQENLIIDCPRRIIPPDTLPNQPRLP
jgi:hypothetical protein